MINRRMIVRWRGGVPVKAYYEAGRQSTLHKQRREKGTADSAIIKAGLSLREQARHLDQNHDLSRGALNTLVQGFIGQNGIQIEPCPRTTTGEIHDEFAYQMQQALNDWALHPEVTGQHDWPSSQRIAGRTWLRDGEMLSQGISGLMPSLDHGTRVPYSIELIEPDLLPIGYNKDGKPRIISGIEVNAWKRPVAYHLYKDHPGDARLFYSGSKTKRVSADKIMHVKMVDRIGQMRGVSIFASVLLRFDDIKDYEESERIAAKVAASMAAYIKKGSPDAYTQLVDDETGDPVSRDLRFRPGMVFDDLTIGEEIGTIDTKRPSNQLEPHRNGQLRAAGRGIGLTYSAISGDYNGTYSAQRQELVEGYGAYGVLASEFTSQFVRPNYHRMLEMAFLSGELVIPSNVDPLTIGDALFIPPQMPWIDPLKEAVANGTLEENLHSSGPEIIRKSGRNPRDVLDNQKRWLEKKKDLASPAEEDKGGSQDDDDKNPGQMSGGRRQTMLALELIKSESDKGN